MIKHTLPKVKSFRCSSTSNLENCVFSFLAIRTPPVGQKLSEWPENLFPHLLGCLDNFVKNGPIGPRQLLR